MFGPAPRLDREALARGNSTYFPDLVVPMLPERISNDLCSLKPNEDRAAIAVRMVIGADGSKRSHKFHRIMMRSGAKLHYAQAQAAIDGLADETTEPLLEDIIKPLYEAYAALSAPAPSAIRSTLICPSEKSCSSLTATWIASSRRNASMRIG